MSAVKTYSTDKLTWTRETQTFSAEASDLGVRPEDSAFGALSDGIRTGLALLNPKTGGTMEFHITHVEFSIENEILWWTLSADTSIQVIIYND